MAKPPLTAATILLLVVLVEGSGQWCVTKPDVSSQQLQRALDYACGIGGADCSPIQPNGLCFLPNTIQAHASYAFNSYFQRKAMSPGSCDFSGSATVAQTDPSYGSCVYPSSLSTAGGSTASSAMPTATTPTTTTTTNPFTPPPPLTYTTTSPASNNGINGLNPGSSLPPDNAAFLHTMSMFVTYISFLIMFLVTC